MRHLSYRPYFHTHPSSWSAATADLSLNKPATAAYPFHAAAAAAAVWMSPAGDAGASAGSAGMARSWATGASAGALHHHQHHHHAQSLHHHPHHPSQTQHQQNQSLQASSHPSSALFQPMVSDTLCLEKRPLISGATRIFFREGHTVTKHLTYCSYLSLGRTYVS